MPYRKKPVVIDAWLYTGDPGDMHPDWIRLSPNVRFGQGPRELPAIFIKTLEGEMRADRGDWIIKGVKGELYPCKPDIFEATYELV